MDPDNSPGHARKNGRPFHGRLTRRGILDFVFSSHWPWGVGLSLGLAALLTPGLRFQPERYALGAIASSDIRAPYDFSYEDEATTATRREEAAGAVALVYDFNARAAVAGRLRIETAFQLARNALKSGAREEDLAAARDALGEPLSGSEFAALLHERFRPEVEKALGGAVFSILSRDIVSGKDRLLAAGKPFTRRHGGTESFVTEISRLLSVEEARRELADQVALRSDLQGSVRRVTTEIGSRLIEPTLTFNFAETERRGAGARASAEPVYFQVKQGRIIVRAGDPVDLTMLRQLDILSEQAGRHFRLGGALGALVLAVALLFAVWRLMKASRPSPAWKTRSFALVGVVIVIHLALAKLVLFVAGAVGNEVVTVPFQSARSYAYAIPFAGVAVLVGLLESGSTALLAAVIFSTALGIMTGGDFHLSVVSLFSGLGAILGLVQYKERTALIKTGLVVGAVNVFAVLGVDLLTGRYSPSSMIAFDLVCGFVGGALVSFVVSFLLPALESLFERTTDIKLLELSNQNNPVLKRLALEAPGTYHHSVVVGTLAEAAAETIGANAVFCRTAALYHDIGKLRKLDYFIENQFGGGNRHDRLSPRMSALIIASHVKEGVEMAKEVHLPSDIIDIIPQHHGTKLITYFYEKAKEAQDPDLGEVTEEEFRYPGPKPQTREAGIIMIADAVEAASRTLDDPSPARLKGVIRQIIDYIFLDGQLDDCDLTLRDLERISQAFLRVLMGIHHHRVSYPGFDFERRTEPAVAHGSRPS